MACGAIVMPDLGGGNSGVNMRTGMNMGNGGSWRDVNMGTSLHCKRKRRNES